jgi:hypothetical protein
VAEAPACSPNAPSRTASTATVRTIHEVQHRIGITSLQTKCAPLLLPMATFSVTASVAHFISVEMIKGLLATFRMWTRVAMLRIEAVVNVTMEVVRTVEPRAGSDEYATAEPLGPVVPVRSAVVWRVVVVAIRSRRFGADVDRDLRGCRARNAGQSGEHNSEVKNS